MDGVGQVALWSPNITKPLVRMLCHQGAVTSVCVDYTGRYMVTTGMDSKMNVSISLRRVEVLGLGSENLQALLLLLHAHSWYEF